jgi:hypothetical protein
MESSIALGLALAAVLGGAVLVVVYRRRRAESDRLRSEDLRALDERISARIAGLRPDGNDAPRMLPEPPKPEPADDTLPVPAVLPLDRERTWRGRLGLGNRGAATSGGSSRGPILRDTAVVIGVGSLLLLVASQVLPASPPAPTATAQATPIATDLAALVPTGTPNFLLPTPSPTIASAETPTPTLDITYEPTPTPLATLSIPPPTPGVVCNFASFSISPTYTTASAGSYRTYSTTYRDTCGRTFNVTSYSTFVITGGTCSLSSCRSSIAGTHTVTATYGSHHAYATQVVTALATPTPAPTPAPTPIPTATPTPTPTATPPPTPTDTPAPTPTDTPAPTATAAI